MAVKIFFSYTHEDEPLLNKLKAHLRPLQRLGLIDVWYDRDISAGTEWEQDIVNHLDEANIILLLVSPNFMDSDYCYSIEMEHALQRHERKEARVIPIILRYVLWKVAPIGKLKALPTDGKPILSAGWYDADEAFYTVAESIQKLADELNKSSASFVKQGTIDHQTSSPGEQNYRLEKRQFYNTKRIGLFLDYDNILPLLRRTTKCKDKEIGSILAAYASRFGEVICRWACFDPRGHSDSGRVQKELEEAGFSVRFPKGELLKRRLKDVSDFVLMECITEESIRSQPDIYLVVGGDSDYYIKIVSLIEGGYIVRVAAFKDSISSVYRELEVQRKQSRFALGYVDSDFFVDELEDLVGLVPSDER